MRLRPPRRHRAPRRDAVLRATETIGAVAHLVSAVEYLLDDDDRRPGGLGDYEPIRSNVSGRGRPVRALINLAADRNVTRGLYAGWIVAAGALLAPTPRAVRLAANALLTSTHVLLQPRNALGRDGSDHVALLAQATATLARAGRRPAFTDACLWYLALQCALSYGVSGWAKTLGGSWRSGDAISDVLRTRTYGDEAAWRLARRHPRTARVLGRSVVAIECAFPLALAGPGRVFAPAALAAAGAFHVGNARLMGLNRFLLAFPAMYPAVLYVTGRDSPTDPRDDLLPRATLAAGVAGAAGLAVAQHARRRAVRRGHPDERELTTSRGSVLRFRVTGGAPGAPLVVCENGLGASGDEWEWVRRDLPDGWPVLTYHRAGYGASRPAPDGESTPDGAVADLRDLVRAVRGDRPVVLVGHSLGGVLVSRAAADPMPGLAGVVAVDPSLPEALADPTAADRRGLDDVVAAFAHGTRWGLGPFLETADTAVELPAEVRGRVAAQMRDHTTWATARRELATARRGARDGTHEPRVPTLVVCAAGTVEQDPRYEGLRGAAAGFHVVPGATHTSLLHRERHARTVATLVARFVGSVVTGAAAPARTVAS